MQAYEKHSSIAALLNRNNVDTDQIVPKQFLKKVQRNGFGAHLFHDWRFNADGSDDLTFELNNPAFKGARILVTGDNFGCGSSREHAPWAIADYGFNTIISTSYADIFFNNCFKNSILPIIVDSHTLLALMEEIAENEGVAFEVDLDNQSVSTPGKNDFRFEVEPYRKHNLLEGLDDIALSLVHADKITTFEQEQKIAQPWLWRDA
ncbi:MAG: 3-isopropylmalate dehydratase small subunit [Halieaceae bacterium]|jgi:3-isopropylmalate/(R)-2-methylmalate dehydratase small subunit|nr:3-isopropylmalate dehydratase small subunit [Halieaceae bacterium]